MPFLDPAPATKVEFNELSSAAVRKTATNRTNERLISDTTPTFNTSFDFGGTGSISSNEDGWIVGKNLAVSGGFGGQPGQGGAISYFKGVGMRVSHTGVGNLDMFWGSLTHHGTREVGLFIGDTHATRGGNNYGGHFRVRNTVTAPDFMVGLAIEMVPEVAKDDYSRTATLATTIPANTATTSVVVGSAVQLTTGTALTFTAADASTVVAYVSSTMGSASTTIPVTSFTTTSQINSGGTVNIGVSSTYYGLLIEHNGTEDASAAIQVSHPTTDATTPWSVGLNFDSSVAVAGATGINLGGEWGVGINLQNSNIIGAATIAGTGSSPSRFVRIADHLHLDNARYVKFKDSGGTVRNTIGATSSDNLRLAAPGASGQVEIYNRDESSLLARITSSGRGDFSTGGITLQYTSSATAPSSTTNGHARVWWDSANSKAFLMFEANGVRYKVEGVTV